MRSKPTRTLAAAGVENRRETLAEELRQRPVARHPVDDPGGEHDVGARVAAITDSARESAITLAPLGPPSAWAT